MEEITRYSPTVSSWSDKTDATYVSTREYLLSRRNPYYAEGKSFGGIGCVASSNAEFLSPWHAEAEGMIHIYRGPHVDVWNPWYVPPAIYLCRSPAPYNFDLFCHCSQANVLDFVYLRNGRRWGDHECIIHDRKRMYLFLLPIPFLIRLILIIVH